MRFLDTYAHTERQLVLFVKNWSLWSDLVILIKTPRAVLRGNGAYWPRRAEPSGT